MPLQVTEAHIAISTKGAEAMLEFARKVEEALAKIPPDFDPEEDRRVLIEAGILDPETGQLIDDGRLVE